MTPTTKNKLTLSILDRLKQKGAPESKLDVPPVLFAEEEENVELDPVTGKPILRKKRAPTTSL